MAALIAVALGAVAWWWAHPPDPETEVRSYHRPLVALERLPAPHLGRGCEQWRMIAAAGDTVTGLWRAGAPRRGSEWAVVILGGIDTDDRAALLVPDSLPVGVLAVSWPWKGPRRMSRFAFVANVPQLRAALLRTPGAIARGVEAVRRACPGARVALLGASVGAAPVVAALPLARPDALVLVDGGADLDRLLHSEIARALDGGIAGALFAPSAAALAARLLSSFEPARYDAAASHIPVMLVDAEHDERYPRACVTRLHDTFPHATSAMHPGGHMDPRDRLQVAEIVEAVWRWLGGLAVGRAVNATPPGPGPIGASAATGVTPPTQSPIGALPATFVGMLPCADCRGIRYQVDLLPNSRFAESVEYLRDGDDKEIELAHGVWWISPDGRKLTLDAGSDAAGDDMRSAWRVKDAGTLRMLDPQGDSIASELHYELTRTDGLPPVWPGPQPEFLAPLANTRWVPLRIGGHAVTVPPQQHEPWIVLEPKTRDVTGSDGCNRFTGSYDVGVETLRIRSLAVTRMMCPDLGSETAFLKALNKTWGYRVAGRRLELLDAHGAVLAELEERNR